MKKKVEKEEEKDAHLEGGRERSCVFETAKVGRRRPSKASLLPQE